MELWGALSLSLSYVGQLECLLVLLKLGVVCFLFLLPFASGARMSWCPRRPKKKSLLSSIPSIRK